MDYISIPSANIITQAIAGLKERNFEPLLVNTKEEAMEKIKELIPANASVMNGSSTTLIEMGFIEYLKAGQHGWNNLHETIVKEQDPAKQAQLRREALLSDYYLGSVHAMTEGGELVIASNTGSQMPHLVYSSPNIILVVSTNKITPNLDDAMKRLREYVVPLEDKRMQAAYGMGTNLSKILIFSKEAAFNSRRITIILVNEKLGF
jgi:hypothetical protein